MSKLKSLMLSTASHEFRNPVSGIISMLNIIDEDGNLAESVKEYMEIAKSCSDLLLFLANDMLDMAQIEAGKLRLNFNSFGATKLCKDCVELLRFKAKSKGVNLMFNNQIS